MQIFLVFCCPRRGEETVYLRKRDFTVYLPNRLIYEPNEMEIISQQTFPSPEPQSHSFFQVFILRFVDNFL